MVIKWGYEILLFFSIPVLDCKLRRMFTLFFGRWVETTFLSLTNCHEIIYYNLNIR